MSTALSIPGGGTGQSTPEGARKNLGLEIGVVIQPYDPGLAALAAFNTNGFIVQTANDTYSGRTITGTAAEVTVTNGDGVVGNPVISLPAALTFTGKTITGGTYASGAFNGTVGATTPSTGAFTTLSTSGMASLLDGATIRNGTINTQSIIENYGYDTGDIIWKLVLESNNSLSFYSYDVVGGAFNGLGFSIQQGGLGTSFSGDIQVGNSVAIAGAYFVDGVQVLSNRNTGWAADTGTATKTGVATYTAPTISNPPTQAEVQAIANALQAATRSIKALKDALINHGIIGV